MYAKLVLPKNVCTFQLTIGIIINHTWLTVHINPNLASAVTHNVSGSGCILLSEHECSRCNTGHGNANQGHITSVIENKSENCTYVHVSFGTQSSRTDDTFCAFERGTLSTHEHDPSQTVKNETYVRTFSIHHVHM